MPRDHQVTPKFRILIIGGSYAGLSTAFNLVDLHRGMQPRQSTEPYVHQPNLPDHDVEITIVDERDGFYHLIGSPLAMANMEYAKQAWIKFQDIPALKDLPIKFIHGTVTEINCKDKKASIIDNTSENLVEESYDILVAASGLRRASPVVPQAKTQSSFWLEVEKNIASLVSAQDGLVVVGGGAVGIEMAAKFKTLMPAKFVTLVHSRDRLLSSEPLPTDFQDKALKVLRESGVRVFLSHRLASISNIHTSDGREKSCLKFTNGDKMIASKVIHAISRGVPSASFLPSSAVNPDGYVKVLPNLMFEPGTPNHEDHFSAGDLAQWPGIKRCGGAMHMGQLVAQNIHQRLVQKLTHQKPKFKELEAFPPMMAIAIGTNAVAYASHAGTIFGPEVLETYFSDDLALSYCCNIMQFNKGN